MGIPKPELQFDFGELKDEVGLCCFCLVNSNARLCKYRIFLVEFNTSPTAGAGEGFSVFVR